MEMVFHQFDPADRKVFVRPHKESKLCNELWLLLVAEYGLIYANSKWQFKLNNALLDLDLQHVSEIPQLFVRREDACSVIFLVIKIVDDNLSCGPDDELKFFENQFGRKFKLGAISHGPGELRSYCLSIL